MIELRGEASADISIMHTVSMQGGSVVWLQQREQSSELCIKRV